MSSVLAYVIPCPKCGAKAGERCKNLDGSERRASSHIVRTPLMPCGTWGGCQRHRKVGETPCEPCLDAERRYMADWRAKAPKGIKARERDIAALRARRRATRRLIETHRTEFDALLGEEKSA